MSVIGCYEMHLYCDTGGEPYGGKCPHRDILRPAVEITGPNERDCLKQARARGWAFKAKNTLAFCPKCSRSPSHD